MRIDTGRLPLTAFTGDMTRDRNGNLRNKDMEKRSAGGNPFFILRCSSPGGPFVCPVFTGKGENVAYVEPVPVKDGWEAGCHIVKPCAGRGCATEALSRFMPEMAE